jgi:hypothetical protein
LALSKVLSSKSSFPNPTSAPSLSCSEQYTANGGCLVLGEFGFFLICNNHHYLSIT